MQRHGQCSAAEIARYVDLCRERISMFRAPRGRERILSVPGLELGWGSKDLGWSSTLRWPPLRQFPSAARHWTALPLWPRIRWRHPEQLCFGARSGLFQSLLGRSRPSVTLLSSDGPERLVISPCREPSSGRPVVGTSSEKRSARQVQVLLSSSTCSVIHQHPGQRRGRE